MQQDGHQSPDQPQASAEQEEAEPEPHHDVDLLVDDVQGHDAHGIVHLDGSRRTVLIEVTFGYLQQNKDVCHFYFRERIKIYLR